jgi:hypothetical protein
MVGLAVVRRVATLMGGQERGRVSRGKGGVAGGGWEWCQARREENMLRFVPLPVCHQCVLRLPSPVPTHAYPGPARLVAVWLQWSTAFV